MFGSKKQTTENAKVASPSSTSFTSTAKTVTDDDTASTLKPTHSTTSLTSTSKTLTANEDESVYTVKPSISSMNPEKEKLERKILGRAKDIYLKFESKTPHGKDREIMKAREAAGVPKEKLGRKINDQVLFTQRATWGML